MERKLVTLDADHTGQLIAMLTDYHTYLIEQWHCGEKQNDNVAYTCYLLGNIEGRLLYNGITQEDLDLMEDWEAELNSWKESNNGQILRL
jgi:hypothetical protein